MNEKNIKKTILFVVNSDWFFLSHRLPIAKKAIEEGYNVGLLTEITTKKEEIEKYGIFVQEIKFKKVVNMGSIGCKFASILRGESDIYITLSLRGQSSPKDWDFAAPEAILKAAGGAITNLENEDLIYNQKNFEQRGIIIASNNKLFHKSICSQIKEIISENIPLNF